MKPSLLCAVSHSFTEPYLNILMQGQEKTWLQDEVPSNIEVIHFHGPPPNKLVQFLDRINEKIRWKGRYLHRVQALVSNFLLLPWMRKIPNYCPSQILKTSHKSIQIEFIDTYLTYRWKFLGLMLYFLNETDHDYLLTTTTSSYINLPVLSDRIKSFPNGDFYYGAIPYPGADFISGSNRVLSRQAVRKILSNRASWPPGTIEDVAVGKLLGKMGIPPEHIPIINIPSLEVLESLPIGMLKTNYHFRLKSGTIRNRNDVHLMSVLNNKIRNANE